MIDEFNLDKYMATPWLELAQAALAVLAEDAQMRGDSLLASRLRAGATWHPRCTTHQEPE
jgi:hypothetical protein